MRDNDRQLGKPMRVYRDTQANIEALTLAAADEGCEGYATDLNKHGTYAHPLWAWDRPFNVKAFGATGAGFPTDDHPEIQAALDAAHAFGSGTVWWPPGSYYISEELIWPTGVNLLGASPETSHPQDPGVSIEARGDHPIFETAPIAGGANKFRAVYAKDLELRFVGAGGGDTLTSCIHIINSAEPPMNLNFENLMLRDGHYGIRDDSDSFMSAFKRVWTFQCRYGFHIGGTSHTTLHFDNCYAKGKDDPAWDIHGWDLDATVIASTVLTACAMDSYKRSGVLAVFRDHQGLVINGFDFEFNEVTGDLNAILLFAGSAEDTMSLTGLRGATNIVNNAGGTGALVRIDHVNAVLEACQLNTAVNNGVGNGHGLWIRQGAQVAARASTFKDLTAGAGPPARNHAIGIDNVAGNRLTLDASSWDSLWDPGARKAAHLQ